MAHTPQRETDPKIADVLAKFRDTSDLAAFLGTGPSVFQLPSSPQRSPGTAEEPGKVRTGPTAEKPVAASFNLEANQDASLKFLRSQIDEKKQELQRLRIRLVGDAHSFSTEQIDAMSIEDLLKLDKSARISGAIHNLKQSKANVDESAGWWKFWNRSKDLYQKHYDNDLALSADYKRAIGELTGQIAEAEKAFAAASAAAAAKSAALQSSQSGNGAGAAEQRAQAQAQQQVLEQNFQRSLAAVSRDTGITWSDHMQRFSQAQTIFERNEKSYDNFEANLRIGQRICIITVAAGTTAATGGAAAGFWAPVLTGTLAGGGLSLACNATELTGQATYGTGNVTGADIKAKGVDTLWTTADCFLACLGAGWAAKGMRAAGLAGRQVMHVTGPQVLMSEGTTIGKTLARGQLWRLGGRCGVKSALPTTVYNTVKDLYTGQMKPTGSEFVVRLAELPLAWAAGMIGCQFGMFRESIRNAFAARGIGAKALGGLVSLKSHVLEGLFAVSSAEFHMQFADWLIPGKFGQEGRSRMRMATAMGWVSGVASSSAQARKQRVAESVARDVQEGVAATDRHWERQMGTGAQVTRSGKAAVVVDHFPPTPNDARVHLGRDLGRMDQTARIAEITRYRQAVKANEPLTGRPLQSTLKPYEDRLAAAIGQTAKTRDVNDAAQKSFLAVSKAKLEREATIHAQIGDFDATPESQAAYAQRLQRVAEAKLANFDETTRNYRAGRGSDVGGVTEWIGKHAGTAGGWISKNVVDPPINLVAGMYRRATDIRFLGIGSAVQVAGKWANLHLVQAPLAHGLMKYATWSGDRLGGIGFATEATLSAIETARLAGAFARRKLGLGWSRPNQAAGALADAASFELLIQRHMEAEAQGIPVDPKVRQRLEAGRDTALQTFNECNRRLNPVMHIVGAGNNAVQKIPGVGHAIRGTGTALEVSGGWISGSNNIIARALRGDTALHLPFYRQTLGRAVTATGDFVAGLGLTIRDPRNRFTHVIYDPNSMAEVKGTLRSGMEAVRGFEHTKMIRHLEDRLMAGLSDTSMSADDFGRLVRVLKDTRTEARSGTAIDVVAKDIREGADGNGGILARLRAEGMARGAPVEKMQMLDRSLEELPRIDNGSPQTLYEVARRHVLREAHGDMQAAMLPDHVDAQEFFRAASRLQAAGRESSNRIMRDMRDYARNWIDQLPDTDVRKSQLLEIQRGLNRRLQAADFPRRFADEMSRGGRSAPQAARALVQDLETSGLTPNERLEQLYALRESIEAQHQETLRIRTNEILDAPDRNTAKAPWYDWIFDHKGWKSSKEARSLVDNARVNRRLETELSLDRDNLVDEILSRLETDQTTPDTDLAGIVGDETITRWRLARDTGGDDGARAAATRRAVEGVIADSEAARAKIQTDIVEKADQAINPRFDEKQQAIAAVDDAIQAARQALPPAPGSRLPRSLFRPLARTAPLVPAQQPPLTLWDIAPRAPRYFNPAMVPEIVPASLQQFKPQTMKDAFLFLADDFFGLGSWLRRPRTPAPGRTTT